jgi:hypothetical protein
MKISAFPWIDEEPAPGGAKITDTRTGESILATSAEMRAAFIADHSAANPGKGLGDRLHGALDWAGFRRCQSCSERQAIANRIGNLFQVPQ